MVNIVMMTFCFTIILWCQHVILTTWSYHHLRHHRRRHPEYHPLFTILDVIIFIVITIEQYGQKHHHH